MTTRSSRHDLGARLRSTARRDEGAGTLEYIGILTIGALLLSAVLLAFPTLDVASRARTVACQIGSAFSGGDGSGCGSSSPSGRSPEDYVPPEQCVVQSDDAGWDASIAVGVQVDGGSTWLIEELGDKTFRVTRGNNVGVGGEVGAGFDVSWHDGPRQWGLKASAGAAATLVGSDAEVFLARDRAEVDRILSAQSTADVKDTLLGDDSLARGWWDDLFGASAEERLEPVETFHAAGLEANASAGVLIAVAPAQAEVTGGIYSGWIDRADGTRTDVWTASADGAAMAAIGTGDDRYDPESMDDYQVATASFAGSASIEVDRDANGKPIALRTVVLDMGHADTAEISEDELTLPRYTETRVQMPLETAADRELASRIADGLGIYVQGLNDDTMGLGSPDTLFTIGDSFGAMSEAAKERGYLWTQVYTLETKVDRGGNLDAKWVLEAGLSGSYYESTRIGTGYTYWNGKDFVTRSGCQ